jgi:hypothetical protein
VLKENAPAETDEAGAQLAVSARNIENEHEQDEKMELVLQAVSAFLSFTSQNHVSRSGLSTQLH